MKKNYTFSIQYNQGLVSIFASYVNIILCIRFRLVYRHGIQAGLQRRGAGVLHGARLARHLAVSPARQPLPGAHGERVHAHTQRKTLTQLDRHIKRQTHIHTHRDRHTGVCPMSRFKSWQHPSCLQRSKTIIVNTLFLSQMRLDYE